MTKPIKYFQSPIGSTATSSTSHTIRSGVKTFTLDVDDGTFTADYAVEITANHEPDVFMYGVITSRDTTSTPARVTITISKTSNISGTYSDWTLRIVAGPFIVPNLVDNPSFNNWQRGTSFALSSATKTVVADRWKAYRNAANSTFSRQTGFNGSKYCIRVSRDSGDTSVVQLRLWHQLHESVARGLAGRTVALSFDVRAGANYSGGVVAVTLHTGTGGSEAADLSVQTSAAFATGGEVTTISSAITPTTTAQRLVCSPVTLGSSVADLAFQLRWVPTGTAGAADYIEITNVKLSPCSIDTPFAQPNEQIDLVSCQYTCRTIGTGQLVSVVSSTIVTIIVGLSPGLRATPSVTKLTEVSFNDAAGGHTSTSSSLSIGGGDRFGVNVSATGFTSLTANNVGYVTSNSTFILDAELL